MARLGSASGGDSGGGIGGLFASLFQPRKIIAVTLAFLAIACGVFAYRRAHPPLKPEAPLADQRMAQQAKDIGQSFQSGLAAMNLNPEQKKKVDALLKNGKNMRPRERRQQMAELRKTLSKEQLQQLQALNRERRDKMNQLRAARQERMRRMLGDTDLARHRENMQKLQQARQQRNANQPKPTPPAAQ